MSVNDNNPGGVQRSDPSVIAKVFRNKPTYAYTTDELADNENFSLGTPGDLGAGLYLVWEDGSPENAALFAITSASNAVTAVTLLADYAGSTWSDDGATNDRFHLFDSSGSVFFRNTNTAAATLCIAPLASA